MPTYSGTLTGADTAAAIPDYARSMLWLHAGGDTAPASGPRGAFTVTPAQAPHAFEVRWGRADGPPLAGWPLPDDPAQDALVMDWNGSVAIGGFVERLHVGTFRGLELVIAEIEGGRLPDGYRRLPTLADMRAGVFSRRASDDDDPLSSRAHTYTCLAEAGTIEAEYLHHAMISELAVDCFTRLAPQAGRWHEIVGLPLLVEGISLLAPGLH